MGFSLGRMAVCHQVMKSMLDRLDKEERSDMRKSRKSEVAEERTKRVAATKLQTALFKHKEVLKKEMLRKRAHMEKTLQAEIHVGSPFLWMIRRMHSLVLLLAF